MANQWSNAASTMDIKLRPKLVAFILAIMLVTGIVAVPPAQAQTFQVLHTFTGQQDGANPAAGLTRNRGGKLYGTTSGGTIAYGSVFQLAEPGSGWVLSPLYDILQLSDGYDPDSPLVFGPDGNLYGTTSVGGYRRCGGDGCGVVFKLQPPAAVCVSFLCPWTETVLYTFGGPPDGWRPSGVVFDTAGNLYGVTENGGSASCGGVGCGMVWELTPSGGRWTETILYNFQGGDDGQFPTGGLIFDAAGKLYGTTTAGTSEDGTVYELSPSDGGWTKTILHNFRASDGSAPQGPLVADQAGNLYGVTPQGGSSNDGNLFELVRSENWTFEVLYNFDGEQPSAGLVFDNAGNLYDTSNGGVLNYGTVFKLTPSNGSWVLTDLHDFSESDGIYPNGSLILDANGNIYGTSSAGGGFFGVCDGGCGTAWEITP